MHLGHISYGQTRLPIISCQNRHGVLQNNQCQTSIASKLFIRAVINKIPVEIRGTAHVIITW